MSSSSNVSSPISSSGSNSPPVSGSSPPPGDSLSVTGGDQSPPPPDSRSLPGNDGDSPPSSSSDPPSSNPSPPPPKSPPTPASPSPPPPTSSNPPAPALSPPPEASPPPPTSSNPKPSTPPPHPPSSPIGGSPIGGSSPPPPSPNSAKEPPPPAETLPSPPPPNTPSPSTLNLPGPGSPEKSPPPLLTTPPPNVSPPIVISSPGTPPTIPTPPRDRTPPSGTSFSPPPPPSTRTPSVAHHSSNSRSDSSSPPNSDTQPGSGGNSGTYIGAAVAGVFIIALISLIFVARRRKRRRGDIVHPSQYMPPSNFSIKSDGNYYVQQHNLTHSGPADGFYNSQGPQSSYINSYGNGSQRGNAYHGGGPESGVISSGQIFFSYEELMEITNGFSRQNVIGEGGFGCVYKGCLQDGIVVAIKQLKAGSGQGEREFRAEVEIISRVHHRHLVSLVGYCISEHNRLLIYEFVPNKTLEHHLHGKGLPVLDWGKRIKIALGSAKGLAYLHEDCHPKIIHRDIKSANILLDDVFEAQVADFGLAKLTNDTSTHVSTRVMGTFGYMAPEYASSGKLTDRSDVYSFGVVLLELITGRKPVDASQPLGDESLVEWARPLLIRALETGELSEIVDPRLEKHYVESEMFRMIEAAAACVRHSAPKRPRMMQVVRALDTESEMSDLSNGVKYGQSTVYDSGQYNQEISRFRRIALGSEGSSEFEVYSGEFNSREHSGPPDSWKYRDSSSGESETRAFNLRSNDQRSSGQHNNRSSRRF